MPRQVRIGEGPGERRRFEGPVEDLDLVVVEVGGIQEMAVAVARERQALEDRAARVGCRNGFDGVVHRVDARRPGGDGSAFGREDEPCRRGCRRTGHHEIVAAAEHDPRRCGAADRRNGHDQALLHAGAVVERGGAGPVVGDPYDRCRIERNPPRIDEVGVRVVIRGHASIRHKVVHRIR